jgi:hypothetical protein
VFEFLADLENHWPLAGRYVEVLELEEPPGRMRGGRVKIRGPLGLGRIARTRVLSAEEPSAMSGEARIGRSTSAAVSWSLSDLGTGTRVELRARIERLGFLDRLVLALGGTRLLQRMFDSTLESLAQRFGGTSA